ncbi:uncharacterized protein LOC131930574 isoform X2 [Physella acuta]|uniref:uncharacterized protein LOC131930574 isoform X2 n=1 Tax=Physella acuta TaxID=109671 RepID=UPI0027DE8E56|nr:uncharacterized protein LOC131930574 isoform X2 [Physella acuta]
MFKTDNSNRGYFFLILLVVVVHFLEASAINDRGESMVTSSHTIQRWGSVRLAENLQKYIEHETLRLKVITNFSAHEEEIPFVEQRLKEFKIIHEELLKNTSNTAFHNSFKKNHPTTVFAAIRNFLAAFEEKLANQTKYGKRLREFLEANDVKPLPTRLDLERTSTAITVIQATYNISMSDLLAGSIKGNQGEPLTPSDCYDIGKTVLKSGLLDTAQEWLGVAISGFDLATVEKAQLTFNLSDALISLAKIYYRRKENDKALPLFEKAAELDPENPVAHQEFVRHRFGRNVELVADLNRDKVEPWRKKYFDMCQNSTNITWLQEQRLTKSQKSNLKCRLRRSSSCPFLFYKEEILSNSPFISLILNFVADLEIKELKNLTLDQLTSEPLPGNEVGVMWHFKGSTFKDVTGDVIAQISQRVGDVASMKVFQSTTNTYSLGEPLNVIDYGIGGLNLPHAELNQKYNVRYMRFVYMFCSTLVSIYDPFFFTEV